MSDWSRERIAWVAGLIEGEGTVTHGGCWTIAVQMTDHDVILRLREWTGMGSINGPYQANLPNRKPYWRWVVGKREHVYALLVALYPFMLGRRQARMLAVIGLLGEERVSQRTLAARRLEQLVLAEHALGRSQWTIARSVGCSRSRVQQIVSA